MNDYICGIDISSQFLYIKEKGTGSWPEVTLKLGNEIKLYLLGPSDTDDTLKIIDFGTYTNFQDALEKCLNEFRNYFMTPPSIDVLGNFSNPLKKKYLGIGESELEERNWRLFHFLLLNNEFWYSFPFTTSIPWKIHSKLLDKS